MRLCSTWPIPWHVIHPGLKELLSTLRLRGGQRRLMFGLDKRLIRALPSHFKMKTWPVIHNVYAVLGHISDAVGAAPPGPSTGVGNNAHVKQRAAELLVPTATTTSSDQRRALVHGLSSTLSVKETIPVNRTQCCGILVPDLRVTGHSAAVRCLVCHTARIPHISSWLEQGPVTLTRCAVSEQHLPALTDISGQ